MRLIRTCLLLCILLAPVGAGEGDVVVLSPEDAWIEPDEDTSVTWQFQGTGLCEPVGIRLVSGESWIEMHMHPLTARVESEEMMIK